MSIRKYEASLGGAAHRAAAREAAEVIKNATKLLRFGNEATNPLTGASNSYELGMEIGNLGAMVDLGDKIQAGDRDRHQHRHGTKERKALKMV